MLNFLTAAGASEEMSIHLQLAVINKLQKFISKSRANYF